MNTRISSIITQTMSSLEIVKLTGKRHSDVLRDIRTMLQDLDFVNNAKVRYKEFQILSDDKGRTSEILLNKDLSLTLVSGYKVKVRYAIVKRWQELENQARQPALAPQLRRYLDHKRTVPDHYFIALEVVALELIAPLHDSGLDILKEMMPESSFVRSWNKELRQASEVIEGFPTHLVETEWGKFVPERCYPDRLFVAGRNHFWSTWLPEKAPQYLKHRQLAALSAIPKAYPALQNKLNSYVPMFPAEYEQNNLF